MCDVMIFRINFSYLREKNYFTDKYVNFGINLLSSLLLFLVVFV